MRKTFLLVCIVFITIIILTSCVDKSKISLSDGEKFKGEVGTTVILPSPEKEHFLFGGWIDEVTGESYCGEVQYPEESISLKADWIPDSAFEIDRDGSFRLIKEIKNKAVVIPSVFWNIKVKSVSEMKYKNKFQTVIISDGIVEIAKQAFKDCKSLKTVVLPESLERIGSNAFQDCVSLKKINIPEGIEVLDCFNGCTSLESIEIPESVTALGGFSGCISLKNITIPSGVTSITKSAFSDCTGLERIIIPSNVQSIGDSAFSECTAITSIEIPDSVMTIGEYAFGGWKLNQKISVGSSFNSIGSGPWGSSCNAVFDISFQDKIGDYAFSRCSGISGSLIIPDSVKNIGKHAFDSCSLLETVKLPNTIEEIPAYAFNGCQKLSSVEIPDTVVRIGEYAFYSCKGLPSIRLPIKLLSIGDWAFYGCGLAEVKLPPTLLSIGAYAFSYCSELNMLVIPKSCTVLGNGMILGCDENFSIYLRTTNKPKKTAVEYDLDDTGWGSIYTRYYGWAAISKMRGILSDIYRYIPESMIIWGYQE